MGFFSPWEKGYTYFGWTQVSKPKHAVANCLKSCQIWRFSASHFFGEDPWIIKHNQHSIVCDFAAISERESKILCWEKEKKERKETSAVKYETTRTTILCGLVSQYLCNYNLLTRLSTVNRFYSWRENIMRCTYSAFCPLQLWNQT